MRKEDKLMRLALGLSFAVGISGFGSDIKLVSANETSPSAIDLFVAELILLHNNPFFYGASVGLSVSPLQRVIGNSDLSLLNSVSAGGCSGTMDGVYDTLKAGGVGDRGVGNFSSKGVVEREKIDSYTLLTAGDNNQHNIPEIKAVLLEVGYELRIDKVSQVIELWYKNPNFDWSCGNNGGGIRVLPPFGGMGYESLANQQWADYFRQAAERHKQAQKSPVDAVVDFAVHNWQGLVLFATGLFGLRMAVDEAVKRRAKRRSVVAKA